jgi:hypothetical protein
LPPQKNLEAAISPCSIRMSNYRSADWFIAENAFPLFLHCLPRRPDDTSRCNGSGRCLGLSRLIMQRQAHASFDSGVRLPPLRPWHRQIH